MSKRAALYARVSTVKQAEGELSLPDQKRAIEVYCEQHGWIIVAEYVDHVSASDENKRRPQFEKMVDDGLTNKGGVEVIVVHSYSRYFRIAFQAELYRSKLKKAGVDIVSVTQDFGEGSSGDLVRQVVGLFDEFQSKEIGKHVSRTMKENARLGFVNGILPFGYKATAVEKRGDSVKKKAEIHKDKSPIIALMFQLALGGLTGSDVMGVKEIAKEIHRRNVRTRNGRFFSANNIHKILHNTAYVGRLIYNKYDSRAKKPRSPDEWITIEIPAIIDEATFDAVHAKMRERDPTHGAVRFTEHPTLLSRLAYCPCGSVMKGVTGKSSRYLYYKCKKADGMIDGGCSRPRIIRRDLLDSLVVNHLAEIVFEPTRLREMLAEAIAAERALQSEAPRRLNSLLRRKSELDTRLSRLYTAIQLGKIGLDDPVLNDQVKGLKGERSQVMIEIAMLRATNSAFPPLTISKVREFAAALRESLLTGGIRTRRAYLRFFLARVIVYEQEIKLQGHKDLLAKAYARGWQAAAIAAKRGSDVVPTQVDIWWSQPGSNRRPLQCHVRLVDHTPLTPSLPGRRRG